MIENKVMIARNFVFKIAKYLGSFLLLYMPYTIISFLIHYFIINNFYCYILKVNALYRPNFAETLNYISIILFVIISIVVFYFRKIYYLREYYIILLLFCFPTIDTKYTVYYNHIETGFNGIIPWGYGILSLFLKKVSDNDSGMGGVPDYFHHELTTDIISQTMHNQWVLYQVGTLLFAIIFVFLFNYFLKTKVTTN